VVEVYKKGKIAANGFEKMKFGAILMDSGT
jgi:hypothetical protein